MIKKRGQKKNEDKKNEAEKLDPIIKQIELIITTYDEHLWYQFGMSFRQLSQD